MAFSINDYTIGKGVVTINPGTGAVDMGNCPAFEFTPNVTRLDHFSSRAGVKTKDFVAITEKQGTLKITFDSINAFNLGLALLAAGGEVLAGAQQEYAVVFTGANDIGTQVTITFPRVLLTPSSAIPFISDGFQQVDISGDVLANDAGSFGTYTTVAGSN